MRTLVPSLNPPGPPQLMPALVRKINDTLDLNRMTTQKWRFLTAASSWLRNLFFVAHGVTGFTSPSQIQHLYAFRQFGVGCGRLISCAWVLCKELIQH